MIRNKKLNDAGASEFDFSYALNFLRGANSFAAYLWSQKGDEIHGEIKLEVYGIEE